MVADCIIFNYNAYQNTCCNKCLSFKIILNALYIFCFKKHKTNVRYEMDIYLVLKKKRQIRLTSISLCKKNVDLCSIF